MNKGLKEKMRALFRRFYKVPWCVPAWGWSEFLMTVRCLITFSAVKGRYPLRAAEEIMKVLGVKYVLPVNKGRIAIELALRCLDIRTPDEVVLPAYVCASVLEAVERAGAKPVYADIGSDLHVTADTIKAAITSHTKCIIVPHLFGNTAPIDRIEAILEGTGIALIDDAAQSFGARQAGRLVGTFGAFGIVSCGPGKSLAGAGGGFLITNDRDFYERALKCVSEKEKYAPVIGRIVSFWFWRRFRKYTLPFKLILERLNFVGEHIEVTQCCTMSNMDGAIALMQLKSMRTNAQKRRINARALAELLGDLSNCCTSDFSGDAMLLKLVIILPPDGYSSDFFIKKLSAAGIEAQRGYKPVHSDDGKYARGKLLVTEGLWQRVVCIPVENPFRGELTLNGLAVDDLSYDDD